MSYLFNRDVSMNSTLSAMFILSWVYPQRKSKPLPPPQKKKRDWIQSFLSPRLVDDPKLVDDPRLVYNLPITGGGGSRWIYAFSTGIRANWNLDRFVMNFEHVSPTITFTLLSRNTLVIIFQSGLLTWKIGI